MNNRLLTTKGPELHITGQNYDNAGNIASKTDGKTTRYMYEYDKGVLELDEKGRQTARNVQGLNII